MDAGALISRECLISASQEAILAAVPGFCDSDADSRHQLYDLTPRQVPEDSILSIDPSGNAFLGEMGVEEAAATGMDAEFGHSQQLSASLGNIDGMGTQVWSMSMASLQTPGSQGKEVNSSAAIAMDDLAAAACSSPAFNRTSRTTKASVEADESQAETRLQAPSAEASPSLEQRFLSANDGGSPRLQSGTPASVCSAKGRVAQAGTGQRVSLSPPVAMIDVPRQESCVVVTPLATVQFEDAAEDAAGSKPGFETPVNQPSFDDHEDLEMRRVLSNPNHVSAKRLLSTICLRLNKSLPDKRKRAEAEEELLSSGSRQRRREVTSCQLEHLYGAIGAETATRLSSPSFVQAFEAVSGGPRPAACEDHGFAEFSAALKRRSYRLPPFT